MSWYDSAWYYRFKVTSDNTKVAAAIKGLAIDLSNSPEEFWSNVKGDGSDIRVTQDDGTTLVARDVISIDTTGETGLLRIDSGAISTSADTDYYIYYGNSSATEPGSTGTYSTPTISYYPMKEGTGSTSDDQVGVNNLSINGASWSSNAIFNNSLSFNGSNNYLTASDHASLDITSAIKLSAWVYPVSFSGSLEVITAKGKTHTNATDSQAAPYSLVTHNGNVTIALFQNTSGDRVSLRYEGESLTLNQWSLVEGYWDGTTGLDNLKVFINGVEVITSSQTDVTSLRTVSLPLDIGYDTYRNDSRMAWNGLLDEISISTPSSWSGNESLTKYNNESNNASFWAFGAQEEPPFIIKGKVTLNSTNIEGAKVRLISDTTNTYVDDTLTDVNGDYEFEVDNDTDDFHAMVEYEENGTLYRAKSKPFIKGGEEE